MAVLEPLPALLQCAHALADASVSVVTRQGGAAHTNNGSCGAAAGPWGDHHHAAAAASSSCEGGSSAELRACLVHLRQGLCTAQPEDFGITDAAAQELACSSTSSPEGQLAQLRASLLLGSLEVAMSAVVAEAERLKAAAPTPDALVRPIAACACQHLHCDAYKAQSDTAVCLKPPRP